MKRAVLVYTRDLRVHDHAALRSAVAHADEVLPLFVFDQRLRRNRPGSAGHAFLLESLGDLRYALRQRGGDLFVRHGDPVEETLRLARSSDAQAVVIGADASAYAQRRLNRLARKCDTEGLELRVENTIAAVPPGELVAAGRDHYRVFTPYWRRWRETPLAAPVDAPARVTVPRDLPAGELPPAPSHAWGGEQTARRRLATWVRGGLYRYASDRDRLDAEATSRLSPYLHLGCLSAREVVVRARAEGVAADEFVRQLCWRDFYLQLLSANPHTATQDLYPQHAAWSQDERALSAWSTGRTGVPIVDAAMRQLRVEGWIHNRARLLVASFLTKTLGMDWRLGADVFFDLLVDGDVANNAGNWQWMAGTGVDSRRNRTFNPVAQARRLDPDGDYVRRYVPELAALEGSAVHEPWRASRRAAPRYPERIDAGERRAA